MTTHFLIAKSLQHANATAIADWGWSPISGAHAWINHEGDRVNYVGDYEHLRGLGSNIRVYLGFGWSSRRDFDPLVRVAAVRRYDLRRSGRKQSESTA